MSIYFIHFRIKIFYGGQSHGINGGTGGTKSTINLADDEHIVRVYGYYQPNYALERVAFLTNKQTFGPYGGSFKKLNFLRQ